MARTSHVSPNMLILFLCSSFSLVHLTGASTTVYFAGMFPSWPNKARVPGFVLEAGTRLALDHINNDSSILPGYTLDMVTGDSKCDPKVSFNSLVTLLAQPPSILAVYGAACSDATQTLAGMTAFANVAQISHTSTSLSLSDAAQYPSLYRAIPTDFPAIQASIALLKMLNWSRVAIIGEKSASGLLETAYEVAVRDMARNGIDIQWNKVINADQIEQSIAEIKDNDVRIIITAVSSAFGKNLMAQAYVAGLYGPDKVWIWLETYPATWWHDTNATQHEIMKTVVRYSFGFGDNVNVHDNTTNTISGRTPLEIWIEYLQRLNMPFIPSLASYSYDGAWFLAKALDHVVRNHGVKLENIQTGNETFYELLISSLSSVTFTGLTGLFKIYSKDYRERLDGPAHIFQYDQDGNAVEVITYDVLNNVTTIKVGHGHLWRDDQAIPTDRGAMSTTVYFAGMFPSLPNKARVPGFVLEAGTRLALDYINNDSSILPGYTLDMVTGDSKCDPKVSFNSLVTLLAQPPSILAVYGAACSDATQTLAGMTAFANVAQVSHTSTSLSLSDAAHYPSLYRAIPTDFPAIQASIALLKMLKWSRVAIIGEKSASGLVCIITIYGKLYHLLVKNPKPESFLGRHPKPS
ncbi:Hypothetical predicted protein [Paramuricea clavata]|uniref:Receptor ligand binding region domain-containing protein n=1 Tax=Paramuricea clavata TaxID=317549 RepID=A0A6S7HK34_PARCT|nr:Hypothetical predicted protein [Paramuricea clavata]